MSANQMKEIVKEDFNQQQLVWPNIPPASGTGYQLP